MNETGWAVLDEAHKALREAVAGLGSAELAMPTRCDQWNVAECCSTRAVTSWATPRRSPAGPARRTTRSHRPVTWTRTPPP